MNQAVEKYQCPGCISGPEGPPACFKLADFGVGCGAHVSGTIISDIGPIWLGMPKGFNRLGFQKDSKPLIFKKFSDVWVYNELNVSVWKQINEDGHVLIRGYKPRLNQGFVHIILEMTDDEFNNLNAYEVDTSEMD